MPYIKTNKGLNWFYETKGKGPCLLFLHGWGANRRIWRRQVGHFSTLSKVVSLDLPGHGKTAWQKMTLEDIVYDIDFIIKELSLREIVFIGNSLGGLIALKFIHIFPEKVKRLVFVDSLPKFIRSEDYPFGLDISRMRKLSTQLETAFPVILDIFFRSLFTVRERKRYKIKWLQQFRQDDDLPNKEALQEYLKILEEEDLRETLSNIAVPVLFMNGAEDYICSRDAVFFFKENVPRSRLHLFRDCGHFPFLTKPREFNRILESFLKT